MFVSFPVVLLYGNCRQEACRLYADIVMSLRDISGYILSKNGRIWTKLGLRMGNEERVIL